MELWMVLSSLLVGVLAAVTSESREAAPTPPGPRGTRDELELDKLRAEVTKLQLDITSLSRRSTWDERLVKLTPLLSVMIAALTVGITVWQYQGQAARQGELTRREGERQTELSRRDEMKPLLDRQTEFYMEASRIVARLSHVAPSRRSADDVRRFWELYDGPLIIVESHGVSGAMVRFGECLAEQPGRPPCSENELKLRSRELSTAMLKSIGEDSKLTPSEFARSRFHYAR
jgi:hypothetical protein